MARMVLTGPVAQPSVTKVEVAGSQPAVPTAESRRLRVSRRRAADPLNLLRIMPAKGATNVAVNFSFPTVGRGNLSAAQRPLL
jgi:hypothetical protein